jgi:signal transduction histidine kinase
MTRTVRAGLAGAGAVMVLAISVLATPVPRPTLVVPAVLGLLTLALLAATWPRGRSWTAALTLVVALASLVGSAAWLASPARGSGTWTLQLTAVLMVLAAVVCRNSSPRWALPVALVAVLAESMLVLPTTGTPPLRGWEAIGACAFWSLAGWVGVASGLYARSLDARRAAAVRAARQAQRVRLAADLHDHVAHDVSAMVLQAQAARVLLDGGSDRLADVLERIEADGARALQSMQRSIRVLRSVDDVVVPASGDLTELLSRYPGTMLTSDSKSVGPALYRVIREALANAHKHGSGPAVVRLRREAGGVVLTVTNPVSDERSQGPGLRMGLAGLVEEVRAVGGEFAAGPCADGWEVRAELPGGDQ